MSDFDPKELRRLAEADARKLGNDDWTPAQWAKAEMQYLSYLRKHRDTILALIEGHAAARDAALEEAAKVADECMARAYGQPIAKRIRALKSGAKR